jgi:hypothetical protein
VGRFSIWASACLTAALAAGATVAFAADPVAHPNFDGTWQIQRKYNLQAKTLPLDGSPIPFLPWTQAVNDAGTKADAAGNIWITNDQICLVSGFLRAVKGNFPFSIVQTDKQLLLLLEEDGRLLEVPIRSPEKAKHSKHPTPTWEGEPIGHWEGDTLVVDTVGFNEKTPFFPAVFHTTELHTIQRIRLINDGKQLEMRTTIEDPGAYIRPWDIMLVFDRHPGQKLREYRCAENNRDLPETGPSPGVWGPY